MMGERVSQSVSDARGRPGIWVKVGWAQSIVIGTWSELVEGRETFQPLIIGRRMGLAKDRSMTARRGFLTSRTYCIPQECYGGGNQLQLLSQSMLSRKQSLVARMSLEGPKKGCVF